jgi:hypothetical protein
MIGTGLRTVATRDKTRRTICIVCTKEADKTYFLYQQVVRLWFLPLFPAGKTVYSICSHCHTLRELKSGATIKPDHEDEAIKAELLKTYSRSIDLRDVWGSLLIMLSVGALAYMVVTHS